MRLLLDADQPRAIQRITRRLLKIPKKLWRNMPGHVRVQLCELFADLGFGESPIPLIESFKHNGVTYVLPKGEGENLRALEFSIADDYLQELADDPSERNLMLLVATYAREERYDHLSLRQNDRRVPLHSRAEVEARAKELEGLDPVHASAVITYAVALKKFVHELYADYLFTATEETDEQAGPQDGPEPSFGWSGTYLDIAETGVFGPIDQVHQSYFHDLCVFLVKRVIADRKRTSNSPSGKTNLE